MLYLYVEAPFATFRTFTAGWYRPTATFLTPSAAYGLLLNIAGIETRLREEEQAHGGKTPASLVRSGLPSAQVALGAPMFRITGRESLNPLEGDESFPRIQTMFQQLHNYPVGVSGKARAEECKGNKYNITPVRREFLSDFRTIIAMRGNDDLEDRVRRGLAGEFNADRYGIPFLGDNAFLIDRLQPISEPGDVLWYERITAEASDGVNDRATRLTEQIDRAELSKTRSGLYAPNVESPSPTPPDGAWVEIHYP